MLDHERLEVYQIARLLAREGNAFLAALPGGRSDLADQFRRASMSVSLNIAEGAGEFAPKEKARFYRMAKRSATECGAILDHIADLGVVTPHQTATCKTLIRRIVGALVKLILATERTRPAPAPDTGTGIGTGPGTGPGTGTGTGSGTGAAPRPRRRTAADAATAAINEGTQSEPE
jgi:four helix bundle protein